MRLIWTEEAKENSIEALVLAIHDESKEFEFYTDASFCGTETVLAQDGKANAYDS